MGKEDCPLDGECKTCPAIGCHEPSAASAGYPLSVAVKGRKLMECKVSQTEVSAETCNECGVCDSEENLRLRHALREMMAAYERRIRSLCTQQSELDSQPWRCAEYVNGERILNG